MLDLQGKQGYSRQMKLKKRIRVYWKMWHRADRQQGYEYQSYLRELSRRHQRAENHRMTKIATSIARKAMIQGIR